MTNHTNAERRWQLLRLNRKTVPFLSTLLQFQNYSFKIAIFIFHRVRRLNGA